MQFKKKLIFLFFLISILIPLTQAVGFGNQTTIQKITNSTAYIRMEQDTVADRWDTDPTKQYIEIYNLSTFNSTFTNINVTNKSSIKFFNITNKTASWGNGTTLQINASIDIVITLDANDTISFLSYEAQATPSTPSSIGGTTRSTTIPINLTSLQIITNTACLENNIAYFKFRPLDKNGTLTLVDSATISIDDENKIAELILNPSNKSYSFRIMNLNQSESTIKITAIQLGKKVTNSKQISIKDCNPVEKIIEDKQNYLNELWNSTKTFFKNQKVFLFILIVLGLIFLPLLIVFLFKRKKR